MQSARQLKVTNRGSLVIKERESVNVLKDLISDQRLQKDCLEGIRSRFSQLSQYKIEPRETLSSRKSMKIFSILSKSNICLEQSKQNRRSSNLNACVDIIKARDSCCPSTHSLSSKRSGVLSRKSSAIKRPLDESLVNMYRDLQLRQLKQAVPTLSKRLIECKQAREQAGKIQTLEQLMQAISLAQNGHRHFVIRISQIERYIKNMQEISTLEKVIKCQYLQECVAQFKSDKADFKRRTKQFHDFRFVKQFTELLRDQISELTVVVTLFGSSEDYDLTRIRRKIAKQKLTTFQIEQIRRFCQSNKLKL